MHPNMLSFILAGLGMGKMMEELRRLYPRKFVLVILAPMLLTCHSFWQGMATNDQSDNFYFRNYASSILTTLPQNAILFINYDQQWTSVRYLQECEAIRQDVTSINLSMMSYEWWESKRQLYPYLIFPGTHYTQVDTLPWQQGGFTFAELLDANYGRAGGIFIGGKLSYHEPIYLQGYEEVPHGIVKKIVRKGDTSTSPASFRYESERIWNKVTKEHAIGLPDSSKYGEDTWEHTIVREFFDHFVSRASHLLDLAVTHSDSGVEVLPAIAQACAWLEMARLNDKLSAKSSGLRKNLGLGYLHMVRSEETGFPMLDELLFVDFDKFMPLTLRDTWWDGNTIDWKTWASNRWEVTWGEFLQMEDAKLDPSYESVKSIYEAVMKSIKREQ